MTRLNVGTVAGRRVTRGTRAVARRRAAVGAAVALALVVAACGDDDDPSSAPAPSASPTEVSESSTGDTGAISSTVSESSVGGETPATDGDVDPEGTTGLTDDVIKVGVPVFDAAQLTTVGIQPGGYDADVETAAWNAFIDEVNERGGVAGRQIEPVYRVWGIETEAEYLAACAELAEDEQVFAMFAWSFFPTDAILCVTEQHRIPLFKGDPESDQNVLDASDGYLSTTLASYKRQFQNLAWGLHASGELDNATIGILGIEEFTWADEVAATLEELGYTPARVSEVRRADRAYEAQIPAEILQMKDRGVDLVILAAPFEITTSFVTQAEAQGFTPRYAVTDTGGATENLTTQNMPAAFDGTIGVTMRRAHEWRLPDWEEPEVDRACRETFEQRTGETIGLAQDDRRLMVQMICSIIQRFETAGNAAGDGLTRDSLQEAIAGIGEVDLPFTGGGSFGPGKLDGADYVRTLEWEFDCKCWNITSDFARSEY